MTTSADGFPFEGERARAFADLGQLKIEAPHRIWPVMAGSALVMIALMMLAGGLATWSVAAMLASIVATGLIYTVRSINATQLRFADKEFIVRAALGEDRHTVPYHAILGARGDPSGHVTVGYVASTGERAAVTFRIEPRLTAPILALRLEAERDRSLNSRGR